jgi:hypothetical protein
MRLMLQLGVTDVEHVIATGRLYLLRCRLDLHPLDLARIGAAPPPAWTAFLAQHDTSLEQLAAGVEWSFATESERDTRANEVRDAVQALIQAIGVDTLTPLEDQPPNEG